MERWKAVGNPEVTGRYKTVKNRYSTVTRPLHLLSTQALAIRAFDAFRMERVPTVHGEECGGRDKTSQLRQHSGKGAIGTSRASSLPTVAI